MSSQGLLITDAIHENTHGLDTLNYISPDGRLSFSVFKGTASYALGGSPLEARLYINQNGKLIAIKDVALATTETIYTRVDGGGANPCFNQFDIIESNPATTSGEYRIRFFNVHLQQTGEINFNAIYGNTIAGIRGGEFSEDGNSVSVAITIDDGVNPQYTILSIVSPYDKRVIAESKINGVVVQPPKVFNVCNKYACRNVYKVKNCNKCLKNVDCDQFVLYDDRKYNKNRCECKDNQKKIKKYRIKKQYVSILTACEWETSAFSETITQPILVNPITEPATNPVKSSLLQIYEVNLLNGTLSLVDGVRLPQVGLSQDIKHYGENSLILIGTGLANTVFSPNIYVSSPVNGVTTVGPYQSFIQNDGDETRLYEFDGCKIVLVSKRNLSTGSFAKFKPCSDEIVIGQVNYNNGVQSNGSLEVIDLVKSTNLNCINGGSTSIILPTRQNFAVSQNGWIFATGAGSEEATQNNVFLVKIAENKCCKKKHC